MAHHLPLKIALASCLLAGSVNAAAQVGWGALSGMGEALQRLNEQNQAAEQQRELIELQHRLEMQRMEREHQLQLQLQRERAARERAAQAQTQAQGPVKMGEYPRIDAAHPEWLPLIRGAAFQSWLKVQPTSIQELTKSDRENDVILLIDLYKRDWPNWRVR